MVKRLGNEEFKKEIIPNHLIQSKNCFEVALTKSYNNFP